MLPLVAQILAREQGSPLRAVLQHMLQPKSNNVETFAVLLRRNDCIERVNALLFDCNAHLRVGAFKATGLSRSE